MLPLYAQDAVLWRTLSPTVRADRSALREYFVTAFKVLPGLKVAFGDQLIRVHGDTAVNTGYFTFSYVKDGETKSLPARYSFTYVKTATSGCSSTTIPPPCRRPRSEPSASADIHGGRTHSAGQRVNRIPRRRVRGGHGS